MPAPDPLFDYEPAAAGCFEDDPASAEELHGPDRVVSPEVLRALNGIAAAIREGSDPTRHVAAVNEAVSGLAARVRPLIEVNWLGDDADWDDDFKAIEPTMLERSDGKLLLYPGASHSIAGEPGGGKTWVALAAAAQLLAFGRRVLMADFESDKRTIISSLKTLGVSRESARRCGYLRMDVSRLTLAVAELLTVCATTEPALLIIDGQAQALAGALMDENKNQDVSRWNSIVIRPVLDLGVAVLTVDHIAKAQEGEVRYARGAGAKLADITGAAWALVSAKAFSKEQAGSAKLVTLKDRNGSIGPKGSTAAFITFTPTIPGIAFAAGHLEVEFRAPLTGPFVPGELMETITRQLGRGPLGKTELRASVSGKGESIVTATGLLVRFGFISPRGRAAGRC